MFTTYPGAEIAFDPAAAPASQSGQKVWSFVEQELLLPWLYLQVVRRSGQENYASMLMMYHVHELKELVDAQSNRVWLEEVQVVTPPHMNGSPTWTMEPLSVAGIVADPKSGDHFAVYKTEAGSVYSLRDNIDPNLPFFRVLFCAQRDIRS